MNEYAAIVLGVACVALLFALWVGAFLNPGDD